MSKISVLVKEPGEAAYHENVENSLETLQEIVSGFIETFTLDNGVVVICNEEGRIWDLPYNCSIKDVEFVGTIILAGVNGDEFCDVPMDIPEAKRLFPELFEEE